MAAQPARTVTMLFTDIEGSTRLLHELGEDYTALLEQHHEIMRAAIADNRGDEISTEGDAFFVMFDDASAAVGAALSVQRSLASEAGSMSGSVRVRMGLHTGEVADTAAGYVGMAIHEAARVASAANGGQILATTATRDAARALPDGAAWTDLGEHTLKDIVAPVRLFQLAHPSLRADAPPPRTLGASGTNLPAQLTSFVGRDAELAELEDVLGSERLVTIAGPGGVGKTRVAIEVAGRVAPGFAGGVWFVDLAPVTGSAGVGGEIAKSVGADASSGRLLEATATHIGQRRTLLVLDNCEHVIDDAAAAVEGLLQRCHALVVITTSREPLGIAGEVVSRMAVLPSSDSVELFGQRARLADSSFVLAPERDRVAAVCEQLDGIPLAIELAAARLSTMSVEQLASQLGDRFRVLKGRRGAGGARHRTLEATIDWSHDLLGSDEQVVFRRLCAFAGWFSGDAAAHVAAGAGVGSISVSDALDQLALKSLLVTDADGFRMLETVRHYALAQLDRSGEGEAVRERHLAWVVGLSRLADVTLRTVGDVEWRSRLPQLHADIESAIDWALDNGRAELALDVSGALWWAWLGTAHQATALRQLRASLAAAPHAPKEHRLRAMLGETLFAMNAGEETRYVEEAVLVSEIVTPGNNFSWCRPWALTLLSSAQWIRGEYKQSLVTARQSVEAATSMGDSIGLAFSYGELGRKLAWSGEVDEGIGVMERGIEWARAAGTKIGLARGLNYLANAVADRAGDVRATVDLDAAILESAANVDDLEMSLAAYERLMHAAALDGDDVLTLGYVARALELVRTVGSAAHLAQLLQEAGWYHHLFGDDETAAGLMREALASDPRHDRAAVAHYRLAEALRRLGQSDEARVHVLEGLTLAAEKGDPGWLVAVLCEETAALVAERGGWASSARLLGAAASLRDEGEPFVGEMTVVIEAERLGRVASPAAEDYDAERLAGSSLSPTAASAAAREHLSSFHPNP